MDHWTYRKFFSKYTAKTSISLNCISDLSVINNQDVFDMNDPIINLLVSDCDRYRRALKILADILRTIDNINNCNISSLMEHLCSELISEYDKAFSFTFEESKKIVQVILTHQRLHKYKSILKEKVNFTLTKYVVLIS